MTLWFLHDTWALFADRVEEYHRALSKPNGKGFGNLTDSERLLLVGAGHLLEGKIAGYWREVDALLGIEFRENVDWIGYPDNLFANSGDREVSPPLG